MAEDINTKENIKTGKCPKCGMTVRPAAKFCIKCGVSLRQFPEFAEAIDREQAEKIKLEGKKLADDFTKAYGEVKNSEIHDELDLMIMILGKLYSRFAVDPEAYEKNRSDVLDIVDQTLDILNKYNELDEGLARGNQINDSVEKMLRACGEGLTELYRRQFENEVTDIDVEIEVLKRKISGAGIQKSDFDI